MFWSFKTKLEILKLIESLCPVDAGIPLIRLGPDKDGGYLVPNDLAGVGHCFSPGVGNKLGFELDCTQLGMKVFLADASVEKPVFNKLEEQFDFIKKFIGKKEDENTITLAKWVRTIRN